MTGTEKTIHDRVRELAEQYEAKGFQVSIEPAADAVPFELDDYRPDLIARRGDQHLIVAVRGSSDRIPVERYRDLAEEVGRHPGWHFVLVTANDVESRSLPGSSDELATPGETGERLARAGRLLDAGDSDAALLLLWTVLETMARRHAGRVALPLVRLPTRAVLKHLYSQGELSIDQFDRAMAAHELRNRLAHGYQAAGLGDAARDLHSLVNDLSGEWPQDAAAA